ncbi:DUF397 domain-containing protein [Saccharothrix sp. NRRL B-16314]|uniref:DUF397 domain-containing protein n=1 Tax=Saccharothrix sp. NRRL B-16314 TaxID=1463825 RepID=UPI0009DCC2FE|nr:DUF397 domain-containing protein [Saccharothrix sp. NRRL B-16314]
MRTTSLTWRTSSYTSNENCVEVAFGPQVVGIRDSKCQDGNHLWITPRAFVALTNRVRAS